MILFKLTSSMTKMIKRNLIKFVEWNECGRIKKEEEKPDRNVIVLGKYVRLKKVKADMKKITFIEQEIFKHVGKESMDINENRKSRRKNQDKDSS